MENKQKTIIGVILVVIFAVIVIMAVSIKKQGTNTQSMAPNNIPVEGQNLPAQNPVQAPAQVPSKDNQAIFVDGKLRSMNEKQMFIEIPNDKGLALNINPKVQVQVQGENKVQTLAVLKSGDNLSITIDKDNNVSYILIKK